MWVGGFLPLGYNKENKKLIINKDEALSVEQCFQIYLGSTGVIEATKKVNEKGIKTKSFITGKGIIKSAKDFNAKQLYRLLTNPIYIGKIQHKENLYEGKHEAIIQQDLWEQVQAKLKENDRSNNHLSNSLKEDLTINTPVNHPLKGFIKDIEGNALVPTFTWKHQKLKNKSIQKTRYRYYSHQSINLRDNRKPTIKNINAGYNEEIVKVLIDKILEKADSSDFQSKHKIQCTRNFLQNLQQAEFREIIEILKPQIIVDKNLVEVQIKERNISLLLDKKYESRKESKEQGFTISIDISYAKSADITIVSTKIALSTKLGRSQLLNEKGQSILTKTNNYKKELVNVIVQGHFWKKKQMDLSKKEFDQLRDKYGFCDRYINKLINSTYLAPEIKTLIFQGKQPDNITARSLFVFLPNCWEKQKEIFGV